MPDLDPSPERVLIFLCDIVDYSLLPDDDQVKVVRKLWLDALTIPILADWQLRPGLTRLWGTGDGFYLIVRQVTNQTKLDLLSFSQQLVETQRSQGVELRVGLHEGPIMRVVITDAPDPSGSIDELAGVGLNDCSRIVPFAARCQIVMTEDFANDFVRSTSLHIDAKTNLVRPSLQTELPISVPGKHGIPYLVRFSNDDNSGKIEDLEGATRLIQLELEDIYRWLQKQLRARDKTISFDISILRRKRYVRPNEEMLVPTSHRYPSAASKSAFGVRPVRYSKDQGLGCLMRDGGYTWIADLPNPAQNQDLYVSQLEEEWNMPMDLTLNVKGKPRAMFGVSLNPFSDVATEAVLAVDINHPLDHLSESRIESIVRNLQDMVLNRLVLLFRLVS